MKKKIYLLLITIFSGFTLAFSQSPGVTDIDGNTYDTIHYKGYAIMVDQLRVTRFNDGEEIKLVKKDDEWTLARKKSGYPAYCYFDNSKKYAKKFGNLYNYKCIEDGNSARLAPEGWHVPTYEEWIQIFGSVNYDLELVISDLHWHKTRKEPITITKYNWLKWAFHLEGGGLRKENGDFVFPDVSYFYLDGGAVHISEGKAEANKFYGYTGLSVICIKKLEE